MQRNLKTNSSNRKLQTLLSSFQNSSRTFISFFVATETVSTLEFLVPRALFPYKFTVAKENYEQCLSAGEQGH